jgi:Uncharacterised nucleotidyltransferase
MLPVSEKRMQLGITDESGCWPTKRQELLLRAAVLRGPRALEAWREWRNTADLDAIDFGSHRMLPQLYRNLLDQGISDPILPRLRSVYRYYWYKNEVLLNRGAVLVKSFDKAGIRTMVLKAAALIALYYRDAGVRPAQDLDVAVPAERARSAMALLEETGWHPLFGSPQERISIQHSTPYENSEGQRLDLHWHVLDGCWNWTHDEGFWARSVETTIGDQTVRALDPTDQLFQTCAHGIRWNEVPPIRWIADAMTILNEASAQIDWERFVQLVRTHHLNLPIYDGLSYLEQTFQAAVPPHVLDSIGRMPATEIQRFGYRMITEPIRQPSMGEVLRRLQYEYLQLTSTWPLRQRPKVAVKWLQFKWSFESPRQLVSVLPYRALRHVGRRAAQYMRKALARLSASGAERGTIGAAAK